jgi:hypothetical protein
MTTAVATEKPRRRTEEATPPAPPAPAEVSPVAWTPTTWGLGPVPSGVRIDNRSSGAASCDRGTSISRGRGVSSPVHDPSCFFHHTSHFAAAS